MIIDKLSLIGRKVIVTFFTLLVLNGFASYAQQTQLSLSADEAVALALEGNISLKQSNITLDSAKRSKDYSWNSLSPTLKASASYSPSLTDSSQSTTSLSAQASIALSPSVYTTMKGLSINYDIQSLTYQSCVRDLEYNVRKSYYKLLIDQQNITLQENNLSSTQKQYESNLARYNSGSLSRLDVLNSQVSYQNAELQVQEARNQLQTDLASFRDLLGLDINQEVILTEDLESIVDLSQIDFNQETTSSSLQVLYKKLESANNSLLASRFSAWGPTVSVGYSYQASVSSGLYDNPGSVSVSASIPLDGYLPWSSGALSIKTQQDNIKTIELSIEEEKKNYEVELSNYITQIEQSYKILELRKVNVQVAEETYNMTLLAYQKGTKDILSLQSALDSLNQSKVNLMQETYTLITNILGYQKAAGLPFTSFTQQIEEINNGE